MIRVKIQINSEVAQDSYDAYRMIYISSDNRFGAPMKEMESTAYPEENGVHYHNRAVFDKFDYKTTFLVEGSSLEDVNACIKKFNAALVTAGRLNTVTIYNPYKGVKIVGYPTPIAEAAEFWRDGDGNEANAAQVDFVIKVADPDACDFDYKEEE